MLEKCIEQTSSMRKQWPIDLIMRKRYIMITTYHAAGHALLGSPFHIGTSNFDDFHGVKIIICNNSLLLYDVEDWEQIIIIMKRGKKNKKEH
jgi:hypothetical protein